MCQFRLDFEVMELVKPTTGTGSDGTCSTDTLTIKEVGHLVLPVNPLTDILIPRE